MNNNFETTKGYGLNRSIVPIWESILLILSIYILVELLIAAIIPFSPPVQATLDRIDFSICIIFLADFFIFLFISNDKKNFFKTRWIDFVSSIPFVHFFRVLRVFRIVRVIKAFKLLQLLRGVKGIMPIIRFITKNKLRSILITYVFLLVLVMLYCSLAFFMFEKEININIKNYFDAIWWSFITVTSVGYGDVYPISTEGRIIGMILTLCGMGLFSLITAEISAKFVCILREEENNKI